MVVANRHIVLGITGSIAAFKAAELASRLVKAGAPVDVIMARGATEFITPLTFQTLTKRPVVTDQFRLLSETDMAHITLSQQADMVVIAPATANVIAKLAHGLADDALSTTVLATTAPIIIAPAMEENMYANPITQENVAKLRGRGVTFVEPAHGRLASGKIGRGRLAELDDIEVAIRKTLARAGDLAGKRGVITAGGTQEPIGPVRFVGNRSSGKMGFALCEAARDRGADVTLVLGPTYLSPPRGIAVVDVGTALEMKSAVEEAVAAADILIMAAAVADYRVEQPSARKIKRESLGDLTIHLVRNPDILAQVADERLFKVGFAAESEDLIRNARIKLEKKRLGLIVANDITSPDSGFGQDTNKVTLVDAAGNIQELPTMLKRQVADAILNRVVQLAGVPTTKGIDNQPPTCYKRL